MDSEVALPILAKSGLPILTKKRSACIVLTSFCGMIRCTARIIPMLPFALQSRLARIGRHLHPWMWVLPSEICRKFRCDFSQVSKTSVLASTLGEKKIKVLTIQQICTLKTAVVLCNMLIFEPDPFGIPCRFRQWISKKNYAALLTISFDGVIIW